MSFISFTVVFGIILHALTAIASPFLESRANGIDQATYSNLERYAKYSSSVYQLLCPRPLGNKLVTKFDVSGTTGFIVRDDGRKEIVVAFRGTLSPVDVIIDAEVILENMLMTGVLNTVGATVHTGFLSAYNHVSPTVIKAVKSQIASYPSYKVVVTGHSLGGALASLGAMDIKSAVPNAALQLYTYGQPRTGNAAFASMAESLLGTGNIFRAVHTYDGVPTVGFQKTMGYRHFGIEYWHFQEPANAGNLRKCNGGEDASCSDSIPSTFINLAHLSYFGQLMALNPLLCI